ncbi:MAG: hypothetical protein ACK5AJ_06245, partial [bacterium]
WLLEVQLHSDFVADRRAPDTDVKRTVIEISKSEFETAAEDLIENGALGVTKNVISSAHLTRALPYSIRVPATSQVSRLIARLGYVFVQRKKWRGENCRLFLKQGVTMSLEEMIEELDAYDDRAFLQ